MDIGTKWRLKKGKIMNKKIITALIGIVGFIVITALTYKSLEGLDQLDLNSPFEVELDDE